MANISRETRAADLELAYRAGFNTAIILSTGVCNRREKMHYKKMKEFPIHKDLALEAQICAAEIESFKKPSGPKGRSW